MRFLLFAILLVFCAGPVWAIDAQSTNPAVVALFERYMVAYKKFDPAIASDYANNAMVCRVKQDFLKPTEKACLTGTRFKQYLPRLMLMSRDSQQSYSFSSVGYHPENGGINILAMRFNDRSNFVGMFSLFVMPNAQGVWQIKRELAIIR